MATWFVTPGITTGSDDGTSWEDAYDNIPDAFTAASASDEIWVKEGNLAITSAITIKANVDLYGGFADTLTGTNGSVAGRSWSTDITTIDANSTGQIFTVVSNTYVDGITCREGDGSIGGGVARPSSMTGIEFVNCSFVANNSSSTSFWLGGGAIYSTSSTITLTNCIFDANTVESGVDAGALRLLNSTAYVTDCEFKNHDTARSAGAVYVDNSSDLTVEFTGCTFDTNETTTAQAGVFRTNSSVTLDTCDFLNNSCPTYGGVIFSSGSRTLTVTDCTFTDNYGNGNGSIMEIQSPSVITGCEFDGNDSTEDWGGLFLNGAYTSSVTDCLFKNGLNRATIAMWNGSGTYNITSCVFHSETNSGYQPAVLRQNAGTSTITNCTIADNTHTGGHSIRSTGGTMTVYNTVIWGNTETAPIIGTVTATYSDIEGGYTGTGNINSDPSFVGTGDDPYLIDSDSPCIDAGDGDQAPEFDYLGNERYDDPDTTNTGGGTDDFTDIGAYEYQGSPTVEVELDPITTSWTIANIDIEVVKDALLDPIETSWTVADITVSAGETEVSLEPIETSWSVSDIDILVEKDALLEPIDTSWSVADINVESNTNVSLDPIETSWSVSDIDVESNTEASLDPIETSWTVSDISIEVSKEALLEPIETSWTIADVNIEVNKVALLEPIETTWAVDDITVSVSGTIDVTLEPIETSWTVASVDIEVTKDALLDPVETSWSVANINVDSNTSISLEQIETSWSLNDITVESITNALLEQISTSWSLPDIDIEVEKSADLDPIETSWTVADISVNIGGEIEVSLEPILTSWTVADIHIAPFDFVPAESGDILMEQIRYNFRSDIHFEFPHEWDNTVSNVSATVYDRSGNVLLPADDLTPYQETHFEFAANKFENQIILHPTSDSLKPGDLIRLNGQAGNEDVYVKDYDSVNQIATLETDLQNDYAIGDPIYGLFCGWTIDVRDVDVFPAGTVLQIQYTPDKFIPITKMYQIAVSALDIAGLRRRFKVVYRRAYDALIRPTDTLSHMLTEAETQVATELAGQNLDIQRIVDQNIIAPTIMAKAAWLWALNGDQNMMDEREAYGLEYDKQKGYLQNLPIWTDTDQDKVLDEGEVTDHVAFFERGW